MKLNIISPDYQEEFNIVWLEITTPAGNMVIQKNHAPTMIALTPDEEIIFQTSDGKQHTQKISLGFAHITRTSVTLLLDAQ